MSWIVESAEKAQLHFENFPEEVNFIKYFGDVFQVTYADRYKTPFSEYSYYILKPYDKPSKRYGIPGELIALYSPYQELQGRTLSDVVKLQQKYKDRVHPVWNIIISDNVDIENQLKEFVELKELEFYNIPFSREELLNKPTATDINAKLEKYIHGRDLFSFNSAIQSDAFFFGRDELINEIIGYIENKQNFGLFGLRKIGKTSVLLAVERKLDLLKSFKVIHIDCQSPSIYLRSWDSLLKYILTQFSGKEYKKCTGIEIIDELRNLISNSSERYVIIFDEIENISFNLSPSKHWNNDFIMFWGAVRALHQETKGKLVYGVAGVNPFIFEQPLINKQDNPILLGVSPLYLTPLSESSVKVMVKTIGRYMDLEFEPSIYPWLYTQYGGHPFLIRKVCSLVYSKVKGKKQLLLADFLNRKNWINQKVETDIMNVLVVLTQHYPDEYENLLLLANGETDWLEEADKSYSETTTHIKEYGIITNDTTKGFVFTLGTLQEFLLSHGEKLSKSVQILTESSNPTDYSLLPNPDQLDVWSKINQSRNELEFSLRKLIHSAYRINYGNKATVHLFEGLGKKKADQLIDFSLEKIFNGESKFLYLKDLKEIICRDWDIFKQILGNDKKGFEYKMDQICNDGRSDAHGNPISEQKANQIITIMDEMKNVVKLI